jgi:hypothetical protein
MSETTVPNWTMTRKENIASSAGILKNSCAMSKCAVDETGMNSVSPWMMPRRKAWMRFMVDSEG